MKNLTLFLSLPSIIGALPNNLQNGTTADATQVMADFNAIVNDVNANAAPLANTALLNANNNFTAVQSGINATDRTNFPLSGQVQDFAFNTLSSTLGTNTITGRIAGMTISGYASGQVFTFLPTQTNTGPVTLNIDGVAARGIMLGGTNVSVGVIRQLIPVMVRYQDPVFHIVGPSDAQGSWTPVIAGASVAGTQTYSVQLGRYTKIGRLVVCQCRVILSNYDLATAGGILIKGLPFTGLGLSNFTQGVAIGLYENINLSAGYSQLGGYIDSSDAQVTITESGDNVASQAVVAAALGNTSGFSMTFSYITG